MAWYSSTYLQILGQNVVIPQEAKFSNTPRPKYVAVGKMF